MPTQRCTSTDADGNTKTWTEDIPDVSIPVDTPAEPQPTETIVPATVDVAAWDAASQKFANAPNNTERIAALADKLAAIELT